MDKSKISWTVLAGFLWGTSFPAIKWGLLYVNPFVFVFLRMMIASSIVLLSNAFSKKLDLSILKNKLILGLGLINGFAYLIQYIGMIFTSASKASLLVNLGVIWVPFISLVVLKERITGKKASGILVGIIGVLFITTKLNLTELSQGIIIGDGLVLVAGILWSIFVVYNKKIVDIYEPSKIMPGLFIATMLPLIPPLFIFNSFSSNLPVEAWISIVYTSIFCWIIPYYAWLKGLKHLSPITSNVILLTEIIVASVISIILLGESFSLIQGIGIFLICLAITIISKG